MLEGEQLIEEDPEEEAATFKANIEKSVYGFSIPVLWRLSETYAFVLDSGYGCDEQYPVKDYLDEATMDATSACYDGKRYYLVHPKGDSEECSCSYVGRRCEMRCSNSKFSAPPGLDSLDGEMFGGITTADLIKG